jgi:hypothetical protein
VAHVKFFVSSPSASAKISFVTQSQPGWEEQVPILTGRIELLLNARVQADSQQAGAWVDAALASACARSGAAWEIVTGDTFTPRPPTRHR